jgi:hypothetical protein
MPPGQGQFDGTGRCAMLSPDCVHALRPCLSVDRAAIRAGKPPASS